MFGSWLKAGQGDTISRHTLAFILHLFIRRLTHPLTDPLAHSLTQSFAHSLTHRLINPFKRAVNRQSGFRSGDTYRSLEEVFFIKFVNFVKFRFSIPGHLII